MNVPQVLEHGTDADGAWLVTAALAGRSAVDDRWRDGPAASATAAAAIGRGLRVLHDALPVTECPFDWSVERRITRADERHDRIDVVTRGFLGLTVACARCHDHKYDPLTVNDFYRFYAYFNNVAENGLDGSTGNAAPFIKAPMPARWSSLPRSTARSARSPTPLPRPASSA